ncbi:hypothetical protein D3C87_2110400 [compost metagenome]
MVGHDIEDNADVRSLQGRHQHLEIAPPTDGGIDLIGIRDVIAMGRARNRSEDRR